jgi:hypothetical protein
MPAKSVLQNENANYSPICRSNPAFPSFPSYDSISAQRIARGNPNVPSNWINHIDSHPELRNSEVHKFRTTGWRNISVARFLGANTAGLIALFLYRMTGNGENEDELRIV